MENNNPAFQALSLFTQRYIEQWQTEFNHLPRSTELYGMPSPCIIKKDDSAVFWLPVATNHHSLDVVEEVIYLTIHPDTRLFYSAQYAGDMMATFDERSLSLIQVWSDEDFSRLEQNMLAHLSMQKRLKRRPSVFIATTTDETEIITIDNQTGAVMLEKLIENKTDKLAENLATFLSGLKPIAQ